MEKLKKTASILDSILNLIYRLYLVMNVIAGIVICIMLYLCLGDQKIVSVFAKGFLTKLTFGGITFTLAENFPIGLEPNFMIIGIPLILGFAGMILFIMMIRRVRYLLEPMKKGEPFSWLVHANFRELGLLVIGYGILDLIGTAYQSYVFTKAFDFNALFLSDKITAVSTGFHFDLTFMIWALALFGLSYIFRYGQELQKLSDETL